MNPSSTAVKSEARMTFSAFAIASAKYPSDSGSDGSAKTISNISFAHNGVTVIRVRPFG